MHRGGTMRQIVESSRADFVHARDGIAHALKTTPDERINWSPSPTARTPVQQVAHAAAAIAHINGTLDGRTFAVPTTEEADLGFREWEQRFATRAQVLDLLDRNSAAFLAWLDGLTPERLNAVVDLPFQLGAVPVRIGIMLPALHTRVHTAQIEYLQTIYGDHDWHLPKSR